MTKMEAIFERQAEFCYNTGNTRRSRDVTYVDVSMSLVIR